MHNEQRTSYRCAAGPSQQALLKVRGRDFPVTLADQSAGGIAVEYEGRLKATVGETMRVRTCTGWTEATVVHFQVVAGTTRIGLERAGELPDPREPVWSLQGGQSRKSLGLLAAVLVIFCWCQMLMAGWLTGQPRPLNLHQVFGLSGPETHSSVPVEHSP